MDQSFDSSINDSPNTREIKKYRFCVGPQTAEERDFLIRHGLLVQDEDGEYREMSTIIDSDNDISTDEDDHRDSENLRKETEQLLADIKQVDFQPSEDKNEFHNTNLFQNCGLDDSSKQHDLSNASCEPMDISYGESAEKDEVSTEPCQNSSSSRAARNEEENTEEPKVEVDEQPNVSLKLNDFEEQDVLSTSTTEGIRETEEVTVEEVVVALKPITVDVGIENISIQLNDHEESINVPSPANKGIDAVSPVDVHQQAIDAIGINIDANNDDIDIGASLADISLDDISNNSFVLSPTRSDLNAKSDFDDSFRTCDSTDSSSGSNNSFMSCSAVATNKENVARAVTSPEDCDDTITQMEKILYLADQAEKEEEEARQTAGGEKSNLPRLPIIDSNPPIAFTIEEILNLEETRENLLGLSTYDTPQKNNSRLPMTRTPTPSSTKTKKSGVDLLLSPDLESPSLFATPLAPVPRRSKRLSLSNVKSSPQKHIQIEKSPLAKELAISSKSPISTTTVTTTTGPRSSPRNIKLPPKPTTTKVNSPFQTKVTPKRLISILDSPVTTTPVRVAVVPVQRKLIPPSKLKTPNMAMSPVAHYINSYPQPTQVQKMNPPPLTASPKVRNESNSERAKSKIPKAKSSLPIPTSRLGESTCPLSESGNNIRQGKDTYRALFEGQKKGKELNPTLYVGTDVKPVSSSVIGNPSKILTPGLQRQITPVSHRHLGKRDSKNSSMVSQDSVPRKFCSDFGFVQTLSKLK